MSLGFIRWVAAVADIVPFSVTGISLLAGFRAQGSDACDGKRPGSSRVLSVVVCWTAYPRQCLLGCGSWSRRPLGKIVLGPEGAGLGCFGGQSVGILAGLLLRSFPTSRLMASERRSSLLRASRASMALSARWMSRTTSDGWKVEPGRSMARSRCSCGKALCIQEVSGDVEHPVPVLVAADFLQRFLDAVSLAGVFAAVGVGLDDGVFDAQFRGFFDHQGADAVELGRVQPAAIAVVDHSYVESVQVEHVLGHLDADGVEYEGPLECFLEVLLVDGLQAGGGFPCRRPCARSPYSVLGCVSGWGGEGQARSAWVKWKCGRCRQHFWLAVEIVTGRQGTGRRQGRRSGRAFHRGDGGDVGVAGPHCLFGGLDGLVDAFETELAVSAPVVGLPEVALALGRLRHFRQRVHVLMASPPELSGGADSWGRGAVAAAFNCLPLLGPSGLDPLVSRLRIAEPAALGSNLCQGQGPRPCR